MSVDVLERSDEEEAEAEAGAEGEGARDAAEKNEKPADETKQEPPEDVSETTAEYTAPSPALQAAQSLLLKQRSLSELRRRWTRTEQAFSFFPESVFLGPRAGLLSKEDLSALAHEEDAEADAGTGEGAGSGNSAGGAATFLTGVDSVLTAVEARPPTGDGSAPRTLAQLNPPPKHAVQFTLTPPVEYEPASLARQHGRQPLPLYTRMLALASTGEEGKAYSRTLLVRTPATVFLVELRARMAIFPVHVIRPVPPTAAAPSAAAVATGTPALHFGSTLTNAPLFRRLTLENPAPYPVPFRVISNHACFSAEVTQVQSESSQGPMPAAAGIIPPESSVEVVMKFLSADPIDTMEVLEAATAAATAAGQQGSSSSTEPAASSTALVPVAPAFRVHTLDGVFPPVYVPVHARATDYIFSTRLFKDISFGTLFVTQSATAALTLQNVSDDDVRFRLLYDKRGEHVPLSIALADQSGVVKRGQTRVVDVKFAPLEPCVLEGVVAVETRAGTFNIRVTGRGIVPSLALSAGKIAFGVVGIGYTVQREVRVTNTCALPLRIHAKPSMVEEEVPGAAPGAGRISIGITEIASGAAAPASSEDSGSKPQAFVVHLPPEGVNIAPGAEFLMRISYAPISTPVLVSPVVIAPEQLLGGLGGAAAGSKAERLLAAGFLDTSKLDTNLPALHSEDADAELLVDLFAPPVLSEKMKARARTMSINVAGHGSGGGLLKSGSGVGLGGLLLPSMDEQDEDDEAGPGGAGSAAGGLESEGGLVLPGQSPSATVALSQIRNMMEAQQDRRTARRCNSPLLLTPAQPARSTAVATTAGPATSSAAAPAKSALASSRGSLGQGLSSSLSSALSSTSSVFGAAPAGSTWEFPVDRLTVPLYAEGRPTMLANVKCVGKGGLLSVWLSHSNVVLGNVPRGARRRDEIVLHNRGDVPVTIGIAAGNSPTELTTTAQANAGLLTVEALPPPGAPLTDAPFSSPLVPLAPGEQRTLLVQLLVTGAGGPFVTPFRLSLQDVSTAKCWHCSVRGFVDDIRLSGTLEALLADEQLDSLRYREVEPSNHLQRVLARVDHVSVVSVRHELQRVEPTLGLASLQGALVLPPALAATHLHAFRRWYHNRVPLRFAQQQGAQQGGGGGGDPFAPLHDMLAPHTAFRQLH